MPKALRIVFANQAWASLGDFTREVSVFREITEAGMSRPIRGLTNIVLHSRRRRRDWRH